MDQVRSVVVGVNAPPVSITVSAAPDALHLLVGGAPEQIDGDEIIAVVVEQTTAEQLPINYTGTQLLRGLGLDVPDPVRGPVALLGRGTDGHLSSVPQAVTDTLARYGLSVDA